MSCPGADADKAAHTGAEAAQFGSTKGSTQGRTNGIDVGMAAMVIAFPVPVRQRGNSTRTTLDGR